MHNFLQPKSALLRSQELINIGHKDEALEILESTIRNRKFRYPQWDASVQEEVVVHYVKLAIELNQLTRDCLMQYRNFCQNSSTLIPSLGKVLLILRGEAESVLAKAHAANEAKKSKRAPSQVGAIDTFGLGNPVDLVTQQTSLDDDELENPEDAPEALLLSTIQVEICEESEKEYQRCLRLCLEVYRTIMDMIKVTPKLEKLYHETAHRAYNFCRIYQRPSEFKRLCDLSRSHYAAITRAVKAKSRQKDESRAVVMDFQNLLRPEFHIETRLSQLKNAAALNLWKDAMQIMEDLYELGIVDLASKRQTTAKSKSLGHSHSQARQLALVSLAAYYEKLTEIFERADNRLFHALSLTKCILHTRQRSRQMSDLDFQAWSSFAVLAVLSVPLAQTEVDPDIPQAEEFRRLASLLGYPGIPSRSSLIHALDHRGLLENAYPEVRELFHVMETRQLLPFSVVSCVTPLLADIKKRFEEYTVESYKTANMKMGDLEALHAAGTTPDAFRVTSTAGGFPADFGLLFTKYENPLKVVIFNKLVQRLAEVYSTISISTFVRKACPSDFMSWVDAEQCLVNLVQDNAALDITIDYCSGTLQLGASTKSVYSEAVVQRLKELAEGLSKLERPMALALKAICSHEELTGWFYAEAVRSKRMETMVEDNQKRLLYINTKRSEVEQLKKKREIDIATLEREREQREHDAELQRQLLIQQEKEREKKVQETLAARLQAAKEALNIMKSIAASYNTKDEAANLIICGTPLNLLTPEVLVNGKISEEDFKSALDDCINRSIAENSKLRKAEEKKVDHFVRALRLEEMKLLPSWAEKQRQVEDDNLKMVVEELDARNPKRDTATVEAITTVLPSVKQYLEKLKGQSVSTD